MKKLFGTTLFAAALLASALFTACNDDDDAAALTAADLTGTYAGTFDFTPSPSDLNPEPAPETGVAVELKVENGKVVFPEFPAATLVKALVGEEGAAGLVPMLGTISYEATIDTQAADADALVATLDTPVLRLNIGSGALVVLITIESPDELRYTKEGTLTFTLKTTQCQLGEGDTAGSPFDLVNELKFTVAKR